MKRVYDQSSGRMIPFGYTPGMEPKRRNTGKRSGRKGRTLTQQIISNNRIGGFLGIEKKFIDYEYDAAVVDTVAGSEADPATALSLTATAQGDGESNRDGRKVRLVSVHMRGHIQFEAVADGTAAEYVRILVVHDKQTNGAQFNAEDVLKDPTNADLDTDAFRNLQYTQRFTVMKDFWVRSGNRTYAFDSNTPAGAAVPFKVNINLGNMPVTYTGSTAAIGSIADNSIHVMAICNEGSSNATLKYLSRCRFVG